MWIGDEGYDIAQSVNTHNRGDIMGTPGDEGDQQCHPYGILIAIGDNTKPQNMATQNMGKHTPFNGRGGFWRVDALKKVGFDHHTVGEDHDAAYRGCAYFGMKGILDNNMLCQEQEPPNCREMVKQRTRWETCALEMRRTFPWVLRSPHYSRFEAWVLLWSQLVNNCNMPMQSFPLQVASALPIVIMKGYLSRFVFGPISDGDADQQKQYCDADNCIFSFTWHSPILDRDFFVTVNWALIFMLAVLSSYVILGGLDYCLRVKTTRYKPMCFFLVLLRFHEAMFSCSAVRVVAVLGTV
jgi:cellulose synthase/poly-beta-1,6-N-acetylglucosamine synthase-like glycosyltransferase